MDILDESSSPSHPRPPLEVDSFFAARHAAHSPDHPELEHPKDYADNHFAAIQLAEWAHPSVSEEQVVKAIILSVNTTLIPPDDDPPQVEMILSREQLSQLWNERLVRLLSKPGYISLIMGEGDPLFQAFIDTMMRVDSDDAVKAVEIVRALYLIAGHNELDPMPSQQAVVLAILRKIIPKEKRRRLRFV